MSRMTSKVRLQEKNEKYQVEQTKKVEKKRESQLLQRKSEVKQQGKQSKSNYNETERPILKYPHLQDPKVIPKYQNSSKQNQISRRRGTSNYQKPETIKKSQITPYQKPNSLIKKEPKLLSNEIEGKSNSYLKNKNYEKHPYINQQETPKKQQSKISKSKILTQQERIIAQQQESRISQAEYEKKFTKQPSKVKQSTYKEQREKANYLMQSQPEITKNQEGRQQIRHFVVLKDILTSKEINPQTLSIEKVINIIDQLAHKNQSKLAEVISAIVNQPATLDQLKQNAQLEQEFEKQIKKKKTDSSHIVLKCLKKQLTSLGIEVIFQRQRSLKSLISMNVLSTGMMLDRGMHELKIQEGDYKWSFDDLKNDINKYYAFVDEMQERIAKERKIPKNQVVVHKITQGSIRVQYSCSGSKIHSFFKNFTLSAQDFDPKGNIQFFQEKYEIETRGGWPYYQPIKCKRYGLKVSQQYDQQNDDWLMMNGNKKEWAVAFHGVMDPFADSGGKKVLQAIFSGRKKGEMLKGGERNMYRSDQNVNKQCNQQKVQDGVYFSPHMEISLMFANDIYIPELNKTYGLIFQCRVKPDKIKIPHTIQHYWVVNDSKDIRPYGVILVQKERKRQIEDRWSQISQKILFKYDFKVSIDDAKKKNDYKKLEKLLSIPYKP